MTLIQIEQDSAEILAAARKEIAKLGAVVQSGEEPLSPSCWHMHAIGHLGALLVHNLLSAEAYQSLMAEMEVARAAAGGAQGAVMAVYLRPART